MIEHPWYELITKRCKDLVNENYDRYGNSWKLNEDFNREWWRQRFLKNLREWFESKDRETSYKKILDVVNIACMIATCEDDYYGEMIR